jgi:hypothetical protein
MSHNRFEYRLLLTFNLQLLASADLGATHRSTKKRSEDAEVEQPGQQGHETDDCHDDATDAMNDQQAQSYEHNACHNSSDATSRGSHKLYEGIHFISPI